MYDLLSTCGVYHCEMKVKACPRRTLESGTTVKLRPGILHRPGSLPKAHRIRMAGIEADFLGVRMPRMHLGLRAIIYA